MTKMDWMVAALRLVTILRFGGDVLDEEDETSVWFSYT